MTIRTRASNRSALVLQPGEKRLARASGFRFSSLLKEKLTPPPGGIDAALRAIDEAIAISGETGERWAIAEVIRLKAKILPKSGRGEGNVNRGLVSGEHRNRSFPDREVLAAACGLRPRTISAVRTGENRTR